MGWPYEHLGELDIIEMVAIKGGQPIARFVGAQPKAKLVESIDSVL